jgi:hypothetical protein
MPTKPPAPSVMPVTLPARITINEACKVIGGNKPIGRATYYRGAKVGRYPAPHRPEGSGVSRVNTRELLAALRLRK